MKEQVMFNKTMQAKAMSKSPDQQGIIIDGDYQGWEWQGGKYVQLSTSDRVTLYAVNKKDKKQTSHLQLQIPRENIQEVINALEKFKP